MAQCAGKNNKNRRCNTKAIQGSDFCYAHTDKELVCKGSNCTKMKEKGDYCECCDKRICRAYLIDGERCGKIKVMSFECCFRHTEDKSIFCERKKNCPNIKKEGSSFCVKCENLCLFIDDKGNMCRKNKVSIGSVVLDYCAEHTEDRIYFCEALDYNDKPCENLKYQGRYCLEHAMCYICEDEEEYRCCVCGIYYCNNCKREYRDDNNDGHYYNDVFSYCEDCVPDELLEAIEEREEELRQIRLRRIQIAREAPKYRRERLINTLKEFGLELRSDSKLCKKYIDNGEGELSDIVYTMCRMKFLYDYCDMKNVYDKVIQEQTEELEAGYIPDVPAFKWAEHLALEKHNNGVYPKVFPWLVLHQSKIDEITSKALLNEDICPITLNRLTSDNADMFLIRMRSLHILWLTNLLAVLCVERRFIIFNYN